MIGTDISANQPSWVPPNARFEIDDASKDWTYQADYFDYIHIRWLNGTIKDWSAVYKEAYRCAKPGAWIEHFDCNGGWEALDGTMPEDSAMGQWGPIWKKLGGFLGTEFDLATSGLMENGIKEAGFTNVTVEEYFVRHRPRALKTS